MKSFLLLYLLPTVIDITLISLATKKAAEEEGISIDNLLEGDSKLRIGLTALKFLCFIPVINVIIAMYLLYVVIKYYIEEFLDR